MKGISRLIWMFTATLLFAISGCGGGGSDNTGSLELSVDPSMSVAGSVTAIATYKSSNSANLQGVEINFSTNKPALFLPRTAKTSTSGTATCVLQASLPVTPVSDAPTAPTVVTLTASAGGLVKTATFIVKPASMTVTPPASAAYSGGGFVGSIFRVVPSGMFVKVVDGDGMPLNNIPVTIKVATIINGTPGDVLFWSDYPGGTSSAPPAVFTKSTDGLGQVPFQVTIDVVVPSVSHVVSIVWEVSFIDPDSGAKISQTATTGLTVTP